MAIVDWGNGKIESIQPNRVFTYKNLSLSSITEAVSDLRIAYEKAGYTEIHPTRFDRNSGYLLEEREGRIGHLKLNTCKPNRDISIASYFKADGESGYMVIVNTVNWRNRLRKKNFRVANVLAEIRASKQPRKDQS